MRNGCTWARAHLDEIGREWRAAVPALGRLPSAQLPTARAALAAAAERLGDHLVSYVVYVELRAALADAREGSLAPLLRRLNAVLHTVATRCVDPRPVLLRLMGTFVVALDAALRGELDALAATAAPEPELTAEDLPTLEASFADEGVEVDAAALFECAATADRAELAAMRGGAGVAPLL